MTDSDVSVLLHMPSQSSDLSLPCSPQRHDANSVKVVARFRPFSTTELECGQTGPLFTFPSENSVSVSEGPDCGEFTFDQVFGPESLQEAVYDVVGRPVIEDVLIGFNGTIFAYGQTGSGKTFTMMGPDLADSKQKGIIPRSAAHIFTAAEDLSSDIEWSVKVSILEIYNEKVQDLLKVENTNLQIKESASCGIYVENLTAAYVVSDSELLDLLDEGLRNRTVAMTKMNQASSRSHELVILEVTQKGGNGVEKCGKLNLVDLAGSEKASAHSKSAGETFEEMKKINLSLSALGKVIKALIAKSTHIPYRDSKLTRLLQESLGGNYKTSLVITCSPHKRNIAETLGTLRFGQRAKALKNHAHINIKESAESLRALVQQLREELSSCRSELNVLKGLSSDTSTEAKSPGKTDPMKRRASVTMDTVIESNEELMIANNDLRERIAELEEKLRNSRKKQLDTDEKLLELTDEHFIALATGTELQCTNEALLLKVEMLKQEIEALKAQIEFLETKQRREIDKYAASFIKSEGSCSEYTFSEMKKSTADASSVGCCGEMEIKSKLSKSEMTILTLQSENSGLAWRLRVAQLSEEHNEALIASLRDQIARQMDTFKSIQSSFSRIVRERPDSVSGRETPKPQFVRRLTRNTIRVVNSRIYKQDEAVEKTNNSWKEITTPASVAVDGKFQIQEMENEQLKAALEELQEELKGKTTLLSELEHRHFDSQQETIQRWTKIIAEMQIVHEQELKASEKTINRLAEQVAFWVDCYQEQQMYHLPHQEVAYTEPCNSSFTRIPQRRPTKKRSKGLSGVDFRSGTD